MFFKIAMVDNKLCNLESLDTEFGKIDLENVSSWFDGGLNEDSLNFRSKFLYSKLYSSHIFQLE